MSDFQPVRFGKYMLLDKIATGGMAQLYLAKMMGIQGFEKLIAIKMILPHLVKEKELVSSFIDEAKLAALLNHQNIAQIYDFGSMEESYFISMEYLFGKDLRDVWRRSREKEQPISLENALYIVSRACSGLAYAHELKDFQGLPLNIIHRDISPQNIFVTYQGEVKILDFGIAKAASQSTVTQFGMIKGKVAYMSPEQAAGRPIDQRSDLFSLGVILYELVTQTRMFTGDSTMQILTKVREGEYNSPESIMGGLRPKVYEILNRAVAKEPDERYQSCSEMLADLEECMIDLSLRPTARGLSQFIRQLFAEEVVKEDQALRQLSGIGRVDMPPPAPPSEPSPKTEPGQSKEEPQVQDVGAEEIAESHKGFGAAKRLKKPALLYGAIGIVVVVIIVVVALWPRGKSPPATAPSRYAAAPAASPAPPQSAKTAPPESAKAPVPPAAPKEAARQETSPPQKSAADNGTKVASLLAEATGVVDKDPQKAKSLLLEAVRLDPASVQAQFRLALAYVKVKEYPKAIETYQKVAQMDPQFPDIYFNLGFTYAMNKEYARAEEMYDRVVTLAPKYLDEALYNLAIVQVKQGKRSEAIANLEKAVTVNSKNVVIRETLEKLKKSGEKR